MAQRKLSEEKLAQEVSSESEVDYEESEGDEEESSSASSEIENIETDTSSDEEQHDESGEESTTDVMTSRQTTAKDDDSEVPASSKSGQQQTMFSQHQLEQQARLRKLSSLRNVGEGVPRFSKSKSVALAASLGFTAAPTVPTRLQEDERYMFALLNNPNVFSRLLQCLKERSAVLAGGNTSPVADLTLESIMTRCVPNYASAFSLAPDGDKVDLVNGSCPGEGMPQPVTAELDQSHLLTSSALTESKDIAVLSTLRTFLTRQPKVKKLLRPKRPAHHVVVIHDDVKTAPPKKKSEAGGIMQHAAASWNQHMMTIARAEGSSVEDIRLMSKQKQSALEVETFTQRVDEVEYEQQKQLLEVHRAQEDRRITKKREREQHTF